ncbi:MAG TPA: Mur ligase family protein, partial [Bacteroidia bacterium]|nr:Mur ligase family protein [Bacteroidia bacterium]
ISGIAWDHINVFPTFENYVSQFRIFADAIPPDGQLIYCINDDEVNNVCMNTATDAIKTGYTIPPHQINNGVTYLADVTKSVETPLNFNIPLQIFGNHNLMNLEGARLVCKAIGVEAAVFYKHIQIFKGAAKRLEKVWQQGSFILYKDFAHAPSKVLATTQAVKLQFYQYKIVACLELHTFSSLNDAFLSQYNQTLAAADMAFVYYNQQTIAHKKLNPISTETVATAFGISAKQVFTQTDALISNLIALGTEKTILLMMTSGTFDRLNFESLAKQLTASN